MYETTAQLSAALTGHSVQTRVEESASRLQEFHHLLEDQPVLRLLPHPVHQLHVVHGAAKGASEHRWISG